MIHLYIYLCVPNEFWAPMKTLLNMGSPVCLFINKIQYDLLELRTKLIFHTAWELANRKERIKSD